MSAAKRLVVCGGSGFLGSRICKYAVARGWDVTSISRSGQPKWDAITSSPDPPSWSHKVSWESADVLRPATYVPLLKQASYVVHSMGILLEADYKGLVSGKESPVTGLRKMFASSTGRGVNPLDKKTGEDIKPSDPRQQFSYEVMNRDSAVALAKHAAEERINAFCYISACGGAPIMPPRYISTKREAESAIATNFPQMRAIFFRPPFMYDASRKVTMGMAAMVGAGTIFNNLTGKYLNDFMGAAGTKPLKVEQVAEAVVEALSDETVQGPVEVAQIEDLATKAWRKTML
ncbi:NAD dependent epimerase/dehydratase family protein [Hirsutella rhossiliensis]|uniref:NAD dependent epimerase/dehydratase family protein n=1 Tax=Hirsutella rhossiliensis TaxID=111463 RepID=A0A9P8SHL7_9HYPO|nr:NAD dependent epimerase/dehydratase family protein [Hirsutella rhossiliensis]KAH0962956.1 NAD dependent epimerase/dehydratase family protein [Hirsutella rhossiliensis]